MGYNRYLGQPPKSIKKWLLNKDLPIGGWTDIVKALETGNISSQTLNGIKFGGKEVKVGSSLTTPIAYYQGEDGNLISGSNWIVCGFNGAIPQYVKYVMNECVRVFVASMKDGVESKISIGDPVYTRTWNDAQKDYTYTQIGTVSTMSGAFYYGSDRQDEFGTLAIVDAYGVPKSLTITLKDGHTAKAEFIGYNMQIWSENTYLDCDAADSLSGAEDIMTNNKQCTTMKFGTTQNWNGSYVQQFLNGKGLPSGYIWSNAPGWSGNKTYQTKHSFIDKVAVNSDALLQSVCSQVNRNWTKGDVVVHTIDRFWLPGCDHLRGSTTYENFLDTSCGLCEEPEFSAHMKPTFKNGCLGVGSSGFSWLRSAFSKRTSYTSHLYNGRVDYDSYSAHYIGFSPACTIG